MESAIISVIINRLLSIYGQDINISVIESRLKEVGISIRNSDGSYRLLSKILDDIIDRINNKEIGDGRERV